MIGLGMDFKGKVESLDNKMDKIRLWFIILANDRRPMLDVNCQRKTKMNESDPTPSLAYPQYAINIAVPSSKGVHLHTKKGEKKKRVAQ